MIAVVRDFNGSFSVLYGGLDLPALLGVWWAGFSVYLKSYRYHEGCLK